MEQEAEYKLINSMPVDVLEAMGVEAYDIIRDLLGEELLGKYLDITRDKKLEAEGISLWIKEEDQNRYMVQVEFKDFEDALYIPASKDQLNLPENENT